MNITIPRNALLPYLERANGVADKKSPVPVLTNVLLRASGAGKLSVVATDLYMSVVADVDAVVDEPGSVALPAKDLYERVRAMQEGPIQIRKSVDDGRITATVKAVGAARKYIIHGLAAADFPTLPQPEGAAWQTFPAGALRHLLDCVHHAVSTDETRAHVNSALLIGNGETLLAVSTDGHRLHKATAAVKVALPQTLVPLRAVGEIRRLLDKQTAEVDLFVQGPVLFLRLGPLTWSTKTVGDQYPPYEQVIPTDGIASPCLVNRAALIDALKAVQLAANDRTGGIMLTFGTNKVMVTSENAENGAAEDEVVADYGGKPVKAGFNAKYVLDALGVLDCDEVRLSIGGDLDPMTIRTAEGNFVAVCMPMRL